MLGRGRLLHCFAPIGERRLADRVNPVAGTEAHADVRNGRETTGAAVMARNRRLRQIAAALRDRDRARRGALPRSHDSIGEIRPRDREFFDAGVTPWLTTTRHRADPGPRPLRELSRSAVGGVTEPRAEVRGGRVANARVLDHAACPPRSRCHRRVRECDLRPAGRRPRLRANDRLNRVARSSWSISLCCLAFLTTLLLGVLAMRSSLVEFVSRRPFLEERPGRVETKGPSSWLIMSYRRTLRPRCGGVWQVSQGEAL